MALEAQIVADAAAPDPAVIVERRRGRDRRQPGSRVNKAAPRRSVLQRLGAGATGVALGLLGLVLVASELLLQSTPWMAVTASAAIVVVSIFVFLCGCVEQRLIEIRLELMMLNGGTRSADRRALKVV